MLVASLSDWAGEWSVFLDIIIPIVIGWIVWSAKKWVEEVVENLNTRVEARTAPIQPKANGGFSLPDAIHGINSIDNKMDRINDRIDALHEKVNHVARDFEHLKGRVDYHLEWDGIERRRS